MEITLISWSLILWGTLNVGLIVLVIYLIRKYLIKVKPELEQH